ncbi:MAG: ThuA domain-containing protein [candidate division WS1 bacterium]|nr:ThuA domain-containing protein [candidate division WS1 bacterium]
MTIQTLLLTGANNHDWTRSSPFVKQLLEDSGNFRVDLTEHPGAVLEKAAGLDRYDLFFSDYYGPEWSDTAKSNFESAVRAGTDLVILHAADNAFPGWVEYEKMVGLLWREGTSHGAYHEFEVKIVDQDHPITRAMGDFRIWDELYHNLIPLHNVPCHILATAFSSPDSGGTGKDEPVMVVTQYGEARVFHMVLGHVWRQGQFENYPGEKMTTFENPHFQTALVRGCEWAATGKVKDR